MTREQHRITKSNLESHARFQTPHATQDQKIPKREQNKNLLC